MSSLFGLNIEYNPGLFAVGSTPLGTDKTFSQICKPSGSRRLSGDGIRIGYARIIQVFHAHCSASCPRR